MNKKITITANSETAETGISNRWATPVGKTGLKRLTIDIPETLHRRFKVGVAQKGRTMVQEILGFIESNY